MENKDFKKYFCELGVKYGFELAYDCLFMESDKILVGVYLQKSSYSNLYYLNIKIFVQNTFGKKYMKSRDILNREVGNFSGGPSSEEYGHIFDLDNQIPDLDRKHELELFFINYLVPYCNKAMNVAGLKELIAQKELLLMQAVEKELVRLGYWP